MAHIMAERIAIIGTGPMGIYTLQNFIQHQNLPIKIDLFEKGESAGIGMPYSKEMANEWMLANIASIEIPPITETYLAWLKRQDNAYLAEYDLSQRELDERTFTPRLLLGEYFRDQLQALISRAQANGIDTSVHASCEIVDIIADDQKYHLSALSIDAPEGQMFGPYDQVVLATGHAFPGDDEATHSYFPSPWSGLISTSIPACRVGVMGTSLSAIDAVMAVAVQHGKFRQNGDKIRFEPKNSDLKLTMMSRSGILPEADFYCPLPYLPLTIMTDEAVELCGSSSSPLDAVFELMRKEIALADPDYAAKIKLTNLNADDFAAAYFAPRDDIDPFAYARKNLAQVEYNKMHKITSSWRYALLRMHEKIETIISDLSDEDELRFTDGLKKVFIDNYAAVPSQSIRRILALHDAGLLSTLALGEDYTENHERGKTLILANGQHYEFEVFIDARGQRALTSEDLPFPSLRNALLNSGQMIPAVKADYSLAKVAGYDQHFHLASIPYLMHKRPFVQGITVCAEIGEAIAGA